MSLDNKFVRVLAYIEHCGMFMSPIAWKTKCEEDLKDLNVVKTQLDNFILDNSDVYPKWVDNQLSLFTDSLTCKLNWASSKQVIGFMQSLGVDTLTKDKQTGLFKHSVDKKVLGPQKQKHPIIETYIEFTEHQKVVSTYGENWFEYINKATGRIDLSFSLKP